MKAMRLMLIGTLVAGLTQTPVFAQATGQAKPNVVFVVVDNWGWGDLGVQGSTLPTPRLDQLATEGLRLSNYNVESQCMPTRSAIHSARLPTRSGTAKNSWSAAKEGLAPWEYTIAELFRDAGYATAMFGKWHVGSSPGRYPTDQGYDEWWGVPTSTHAAKYASSIGFDPETLRATKGAPAILQSTRGEVPIEAMDFTLETRGKADEMITDRSVAFIKEKSEANEPFFLMVTTLALHPPMVPNPNFEGKSGFGPFPDMLMELDHNVGRIIDAIDDAGIADNTIIILSGENGAFEGVPVTGQGFGTGNNGPWRGGLGTGYEGGFRSPAMIRWLGKIQAGRVSDEIFAALDWMPTLATMIGEAQLVPSDRPIDGIDQSDFLLGTQVNSNREFHAMFIGDDLVAVKWRNFKMHFQTREGRVAPVVKWNVPLLYNVGADPGETRELNQTEEVGEYVWAATEALMYIGEIMNSMQEYPNIKPGEDFTGYEK